MYDAIIVGAGPGGSTAAHLLARKGLSALTLDRATFPRDKICGDACGGKSMTVLRRLGLERAVHDAGSVGSWGVTFSGPRGDVVEIPFRKALGGAFAPGYVLARERLDALLFDAAVAAGARIVTGASVTGLVRDGDAVRGVRWTDADGRSHEDRARVVVGADGAYSIVARELGMGQLDPRHYVAAVRAYYEGVTGFNALDHIELHFVEETLPGYFWIFPMAEGRANVGLGMLSAAIKRKDARLKDLLERVVNHERFAHRFAGARRLGPVKGWGLPVGSKPRRMAGDGWMLVGDAASLIDPFTGEGIGNAMVSGFNAAECIARCAAESDFSPAALAAYERETLRVVRDELRLSHTLQRMSRSRFLLDLVIGKAARSPALAADISAMFDDMDERRRLLSPAFYWRALTA